MVFFWTKTPQTIKKLLRNYIWDVPNTTNTIYLTFDDGPIPEVTEWVLDVLKEENSKATFFCIGDNIQKYPAIFQKVLAENHSIGNHTFNHLKGWKTPTKEYIKNTLLCQSQFTIHSSQFRKLFRPPYGKIKLSQARKLRKLGYKIIMWDVISFDFDQTISREKCLENVLKNVESGSIIVFHDSKKAWKNLEYVLPKTLKFLNEKGFTCEKID